MIYICIRYQHLGPVIASCQSRETDSWSPGARLADWQTGRGCGVNWAVSWSKLPPSVKAVTDLLDMIRDLEMVRASKYRFTN